MKKTFFRVLGLLFYSVLAVGLVLCLHRLELSEHKHSYSTVITNPTCEEGGYTTYTCSCGDSYVDDYTIPLGHAYGEWASNGDGTHTRICSHDEEHTETLACSGGTATCTQKAICDTCNAEYGDCGHTEAFEAEIAPTCLKKGYTDRVYCSECGETLRGGEAIPKTGHLLGDWYTVSESTDTVAGVQRRDCSQCSYYETNEMPLKGHCYEAASVVDPTCAEYGYTLYRCTDCSHTYKDDFTDKLPHSESVTIVEATCVSDGYALHRCLNCGYEYITDHVAALGHVYGEWKTVEKASCESAGSERRECLHEHCEEVQTRSVSETGHRYILSGVKETWEKIETTYTCDVCRAVVVITDESKLYDVSRESQLIDRAEDFSFTVVCAEEDAESFIRENLVIVDAYFLDTEYESRAEAKRAYSLVKSATVENGWVVSPLKPYEQGYTYVAKIETGLTFADYYGYKLTYSIKSEERTVVSAHDNVLFLQSLEKNSPGYYPYEMSADGVSEYVYLTLQKADGIQVGDILFVGDAESITEIFHCDTECYFGKVEVIYVNDDSEYIFVLSCPDLGEIFEELDVHYEEAVDFDRYPESAENIKREAVAALYASDDFAEFLAVSDISLQNYCGTRKLKAEALTKSNFADNVKIDVPTVRISGATIYLKLTGSYQNQLKTQSGTNIGNFSISFSLEVTVGFNVSVDYKLTYFWFFPTGVEFFDIKLTQTDDFKFDFNVSFNVDYELSGDKVAEKYVYHKVSKKIHAKTCSHVENGDPSNFVAISAEELYDYSCKPGFSVCMHCQPVDGLDRTAFVVNTSTSVVHCHDCYYAQAISLENRKVVYSLKGLGAGYEYCDYCKPKLKTNRDFETEMLKTLEYADWATKVNEIKEMAAESGSEEYKTSGLRVCTLNVPFAYIFSLNLDVRIILSFQFDASLDCHYEQAHTNVYGIRLEHGRVKSYSSHHEDQQLGELTLVGSMDFKVGVNADVYVSIIGLSRWVRAGFTAEAGLYVDVDGVVHITSDTSVKNYAAVYFEAGPYVDVAAYYKLFVWNGSATIYSQKFPVFVYGYDKAYYGYVNDVDSIDLSAGEYVLEQDDIFAVYYYDVKGQKTGSEILSLNGGKLYTIGLSLQDGTYCSIEDGKLVVSPNAPCTFSDVLTVSIVGDTSWKKYVKGSSAFFLDSIQITVNYSGGNSHAYVTDERVDPTCTKEGYTDETCSLCGDQRHTVLTELGHAYGQWVSNGDGTHTKTCAHDGSHTVTESCYGGTATCTQKAACQVCGGQYGELATHIYDRKNTSGKYLKSSATCLSKAVYYYSCQCGEKGAETFEYGALAAHTESNWVIDVAAEDRKEGSKHTYCTVCNKILQTATIPQLKTESVGLSYSVNSDGTTCTIAGIGTCTDTDLVIPEKIDGYKVTGIGGYAFDGCSSLTSVDIPNGVTSIGYAAFKGCSGLTSVTIGNGVTSIGGYSFSGCSSLKGVYYTGTVDDWAQIQFNSYDSNPLNYAKNLYIDNELLIKAEITKATKISSYAFYGCSSMTSIKIPNSVTSIGEEAFCWCESLTSATIGNNVTSIERYTFYNCSSLTSIEIPNSVTNIGSHAFSYCSSLTSVTIGNGVTSIGSHAFSYCSSLTSVTIGNGVTSIGGSAFKNCSRLTSIEIPNSVTSIGEEAFCWCESLTSVTIGNSVTSIGEYAFSGCSSLTNVTIGNSVTSIGDGAFNQCSSLTSINIPDCVTSIGNHAFNSCSSLMSIEIPNGVKSIGYGAFWNCSRLTSIDIPNSVTSIGNHAFFWCSRLTSITFNGTKAEWRAIEKGENWSEYSAIAAIYCTDGDLDVNGNEIATHAHTESDWIIDVEATYESVGSKHTYCTVCNKTLQTATIPQLKAESVGLAYSVNSDGTTCKIAGIGTCTDTDIVIPENINGYKVTGIAGYAFYKCSSLTSVTIGNGVTSIGNYAFEECSSLTSVYYTGTVDEWVQIKFTEFYSNPLCYAKNLYIDNELLTKAEIMKATKISDYALNLCSSLTSVAIGNSVTYIGNHAFSGCSSLTNVTIGNSVTSIGDGAFNQCSSLTSINIPDCVTSIGNHAFNSCSSLTSIEIPNGVKSSIGIYAFLMCSGLMSVTIGNSVTSIEAQAFSKCYGLTSINIPDSVTSIGDYAFNDCSRLTSVTIGNGVTSIEKYAFSECYNLTSITFKGTKEQWKAIEKDDNWDSNSSIATIHCTDGDISLTTILPSPQSTARTGI